MGKLMKEYYDIVEIALKLIEEEDISWVDAIEKAKSIVKEGNDN